MLATGSRTSQICQHFLRVLSDDTMMLSDVKKSLIFIEYPLAVFAGIPPAFLLVFNAVFSDSVSIMERFLSFVFIVVAYGILGLVFGFIWPRCSWQWGIWLSIAAFLIVGWYSFRETAHIPLHFSYLAATATSACLAALVGARLSVRRKQKGK